MYSIATSTFEIGKWIQNLCEKSLYMTKYVASLCGSLKCGQHCILFWGYEKRKITSQRTEGNIKQAFSLAQGKVGLFCGHVVGFDGGEHGKPDPFGIIVSKRSPTTSRYRRLQWFFSHLLQCHRDK